MVSRSIEKFTTEYLKKISGKNFKNVVDLFKHVWYKITKATCLNKIKLRNSLIG